MRKQVKNIIGKCYKKGSFTIELSMIMPGIVAVFILVIILCIYEYDCSFIEGKSYVNLLNNENKKETEIISDIETDIDNGLLGNWDKEVEVIVNGSMLTADIQAEMKVGNGMFLGYLNKTLFSYHSATVLSKHNEPMYVRKNKDMVKRIEY